MQAQPRVEFVPEQHTDFIFLVDVPIWPLALVATGIAVLVVGLAMRWRRRKH
jgi:cell division protein FtsW (lipid II flippase)